MKDSQGDKKDSLELVGEQLKKLNAPLIEERKKKDRKELIWGLVGICAFIAIIYVLLSENKSSYDPCDFLPASASSDPYNGC